MTFVSRLVIQTSALLFGLLLLAGTVHAQQPGVDCAPIQGQGWQGCAPLNNGTQQPAQPQPPPARWVDMWMAIATDSIKGSLGTSTGMPDRHKAEQVAMAACHAKGGVQCKLDVSYGNGCAAMVIGDGGYNSNDAATLNEAIRLSMQNCANAGHTKCHV